MRKTLFPAIAAVVLTSGIGARAIDRNAAMIDSIGLEATSFSDGYGLGLLLWGENAAAALPQKWAVVAGIGGGRKWYDVFDDPRFLDLSLGVKYYPWKLTGLSLYGTYSLIEWGAADALAATFEIKQRLITADDPVSPYVKAVASARDYGEAFGELAAGVDFMMRDDFAIVFEGGYFVADDMAGESAPVNGWIGGVHMKYYWD
ncbi:MAG: hypothetical protein FJ225_04450 [Lentisphaerae bacterium]|nr:hypothetical protein [Lentisphaerota bacterium]